MAPQRSDASAPAAHAHEPRLLGVPVPARAFGFASGWSRTSCAPSHGSCREQRDLRLLNAVAMPVMEWRVKAVPSASIRSITHRYDKSNTIEQEVAAA